MPRREFTKDTRRQAYARSGGICECHRVPQLKRPRGCGQRLGPADTFYEHIIQDGIGGDPSLENCAVLVKTCWKEKSNLIDIPTVAEAKRQHDREIGIGRADLNAPAMPGSRRSGWIHRMGKRGREAWERRP